MVFTSLDFVLFFAILFPLQRLLSGPARVWLLLSASYLFYGWWDWRFLGLILFSSLVDYGCGLAMESRRFITRRTLILIISLVVNLGTLMVFKYFNFFINSLTASLHAMEMGALADRFFHYQTLNIILPAGISFYTFQSLSYTIDIYRREMKPTRSLPNFLLYVSFFPQLVAGPIERAKELLPQIEAPTRARLQDIREGLLLTLVGFFKKIVIADNMAIIVDTLFAEPERGAGAILIAGYAFAIQIYCDFSGYTDIARGVARMMGYRLRLNFNLPYMAATPQSFWRRWHMSLSTWFRDYVYIPLGGSRSGRWRTSFNLMATMLLCGLWHGADWRFVVWGGYHGLLLMLTQGLQRLLGQPLPDSLDRHPASWLGVFVTFHLVCIGWVLFRSEDLGHFLHIANIFATTPLSQGITPGLLLTFASLTLPLMVFQVVQHTSSLTLWNDWSPTLRVAGGMALLGLILFMGPAEKPDFIYFQF
ncbi:MAG: MBOAT family protein [Magnetococcales bacterium]|nr:MBOAT family protein [Magnetococcales bacterium]